MRMANFCAVSYNNISPSFIVTFKSIQEKQKKHFLIYNNLYDDAMNFEVWIDEKHKNPNILKMKYNFFFNYKIPFIGY